MKNWQFATLLATLVLGIALLGFAQSYGALGFTPIAPAVANCPAGIANGTMFCTVGTSSANYAVYVSFNGGAYQLLVPPSGSAGVISFNGRTGAVTLTKPDVTGTGVAVATTVTSSASSTLQ